MPCANSMCKEVLGEASAAKLGDIPLSACTIKRRIIDMGDDIQIQLYDNVASQEFVIQLDESTDIAKKDLLLVCVRYKNGHDFV